MKKYFNSMLEGNKIAIYIIAYIVMFIILMLLGSIVSRVNPSLKPPIVLLIVNFVLLLAGIIVIYFFFIKYFIETLSLGRQKFDFVGSIQEVFPKFGIWMFLSIITAGIYIPWMIKNVISYLAESIQINNKSFKFKGSGVILFAIIAGFYSFFFIFTFLVGGIVNISLTDYIIYIIFTMILYCPFQFLFINWFLNFKIGDDDLSYEGNFGNAILIIFVNNILSMITFGIYKPAGMIRIYEHFTNNIVIRKDHGLKIMHTGFNKDKLSEGFGMIFIQLLLSSFTFQFYLPWAYAKIIPWFVRNTYLINLSANYDDDIKKEKASRPEEEEEEEEIIFYED